MLKSCEMLLRKAEFRLAKGDFAGANVILRSIEDCGADERDCPFKCQCLANTKKVLTARIMRSTKAQFQAINPKKN